MDNIILRFHDWEDAFPTKYYVFRDTYNYEDVNYNMIEVSFDYTHNTAIGCFWCCFPRSECLGYHLGDNESVFILTDFNNNEPKFVYFKAHGRGQGMWLPYNQCIKEDGNLVVYVARGSHAFYPYSNIWWRAFIFASDYTNDLGESLTYKIKDKNDGNITKFVPNKSITYCERCCLCCCMDSIRMDE